MAADHPVSLISTLVGIAYIALILLFILIIIMRRRPVGVSLSWLLLLFVLPIAGIVLFLLFGTRRLGTKRLKRAEQFAPTYTDWIEHLKQVLPLDSQDKPENSLYHNRIYNLTEHTTRIPAISGNQLMLFHETQSIFHTLVEDIDRAEQSIHMEFYIWMSGGWIDTIIEAIARAALRGVCCRILLDAVGSNRFFNSPSAAQLKKVGVQLKASLPVGPVRMLFERMDLRNHRKLVIIDDDIAWTGSLNLADPSLFKQRAGVGQWVDAMVRIQGPAAHVSGAVFHYDWALETGESLPIYRQPFEYQEQPSGQSIPLHVLPSGPGPERATIHMVLLSAIYQSQKELIITSPYLIPDEALVSALCSAAMRGVQVTLVTPEKNDSRMVHYASRSYYEDLLNAGITIMHFTGGLLHTKCVLVDRETVLFGTVNLDMRSVWLNFELTLIIYDPGFGENVATLLEEYISCSHQVSAEEWKTRRFLDKLRENSAQLLSPLL